MSQPLVCILTPSFSQGRWLGDNLPSVASQTYSSSEHVVMDGGSTDNTLAVLREAPGRVGARAIVRLRHSASWLSASWRARVPRCR